MQGPGAAFEDGILVSKRFDDIYATREGALEQARSVFLTGCGLPERWRGRSEFTVAELGFGTGLNQLALLDLWAKQAPPGARLRLFSAEAFLLDRADAAQALAAYPELQPLAALLLAQWPQQREGVVRIDFPDHRATLDLFLMEATTALRQWQGRADAWFLDGFAPAKNPDMWSVDLLQLVGARSQPGAHAATWSVAGAVRAGLQAAGFAIERKAGFGSKRQRLEAVRPGDVTERQPLRVAILGAGIAGASLARAFCAAGVAPRLFASGPMASANPAALIMPRLASASAVASRLHAQAFQRAVHLIRREAPEAILDSGAFQHLKREEVARAAATIDSGLFAQGSLSIDDGRLWVRDGLVVSPARLRAAWLPKVEILPISRLRQEGDGWWLEAEDGGHQGPFDAVVLAAGYGTKALSGLPLRAIRGQVTTAAVPLNGPAESWGGYLIPTEAGLLFGATHGRNDADGSVRASDEAVNLAALQQHKPQVAAQLAGQPLTSFAGVRAATGYNQPVATELQPGLYALTGLAGRGFSLAPLLAEHVAALALGAPSPLPAEAVQLLNRMR